MKKSLRKNIIYIVLSIFCFCGMIFYEEYFMLFLVILVILSLLFNNQNKNNIPNYMNKDALNGDIVLEKYNYDFLIDKLAKNANKILYLQYNEYKVNIFTPYNSKKEIYVYIYGKNLKTFFFNDLEEKLKEEVEFYNDTNVKNFIFQLEEKDKKIFDYLLYCNQCTGGRGWSNIRQIIAIINSERKSYYGALGETDDEARYLLNKLKVIKIFK